MVSTAPVVLMDEPADVPARPSWFARLMAARGIWALSDQAVCSLGNFLTGIIMARGLAGDAESFGIYCLIFSVLLFLNTVHGAIVDYPMTLEGAAAPLDHFRRVVRRAIQFTLTLAPPLAVALVAATYRVDRLSLLLPAFAAMTLWHVQETCRRALLARLRHREAVLGDAVSFLGQVAVLWLLWRSHRLSPETAMIAIATTSGLAALVQAFQLFYLGRPRQDIVETVIPGSTSSFGRDARQWWSLGRWLVITCFVNLGTIYLTPWVLEAARGEASVGSYTALITVLNLTNPVLFSLAGLVVAAVATERNPNATPQEIFKAARRTTLRYTAAGMALVLPYYLIVLIAPDQILRLFYGPDSPHLAYAGGVRYLILTYGLLFLAQMAISLLNGLGEARASFIATLSSSLATVVVVVPLVFKFGLTGAFVGGAIPMVVQLVIALYMVRRVERRGATNLEGTTH